MCMRCITSKYDTNPFSVHTARSPSPHFSNPTLNESHREAFKVTVNVMQNNKIQDRLIHKRSNTSRTNTVKPVERTSLSPIPSLSPQKRINKPSHPKFNYNIFSSRATPTTETERLFTPTDYPFMRKSGIKTPTHLPHDSSRFQPMNRILLTTPEDEYARNNRAKSALDNISKYDWEEEPVVSHPPITKPRIMKPSQYLSHAIKKSHLKGQSNPSVIEHNYLNNLRRSPVPEVKISPLSLPMLSSLEGNEEFFGTLSTNATPEMKDSLYSYDSSDLQLKFVCRGHRNAVNAMAFDRGRIWTGGADYKIMLWYIPVHFNDACPDISINRKRGNILNPINEACAHKKAINSLCYLDNGLVVSSSADSSIKIWNVSKHNSQYSSQHIDLRYTLKGHTASVTSLVSPSPKTLLSSSSDCSIQVWDIETRKTPHGGYREHERPIKNLLILNPSIFLSGSEDCSVKLWDLRSRRSIATFIGHAAGVNSLCTWDDFSFYTASGDCTIKVVII